MKTNNIKLIPGEWYLVRKVYKMPPERVGQNFDSVLKYTDCTEDAYYKSNLFGPECNLEVISHMVGEELSD